MVINELSRELAAFVRETISGLDYLETNTGKTKPPQVLEGWLDFKNSEKEQEDFPFILVRPLKGEIVNKDSGHKYLRVNQDTNRIDAELLIGVFAQDMAGYGDLMNIIERLLIAFYALPGHILAERFMLLESSWDMQDTQTWPYWFATITLTFEAGIPQGQTIPEMMC